ncbi:hypothetical protein JXA32_09195 [Candidatus Sumerlaeota bacterium]|nr:hypothetical protein [Candidatus Sumerlaeota bacterium]
MRHIFCILIAVMTLSSIGSGAFAASEAMREDQPTFFRGSQEAVELNVRESAGQIFHASARFNTVFVQYHHVVGRFAKAQLALYGPLDDSEDINAMKQKKIAEQTFQFQDDGQLDDGKWLVLYFKPQEAGTYYWELTNPESRGILGCYARKQSSYTEGHAVVRGTPEYWLDLCSFIGFYDVDTPLALPDEDVEIRRLDEGSRIIWRYWGGFVYDDDHTPKGWDGELCLLRNLGLRNLQPKDDTQVIESLSAVQPFASGDQLLQTEDVEQFALMAQMLRGEEPGALVAYAPFADAATPERLEMLRWLMLWQLDGPLGFSLGGYADYQPMKAGQFRYAHPGYVAARAPQNAQGRLVRLKRELRAWSELGAVIESPPWLDAKGPGILTVLDGDHGPWLPNAATISAQDFAAGRPESLKPFGAIVVAGEVNEAMLARLEDFVRHGGRAVFALQNGETAALPDALNGKLQWNAEIPESPKRLLLHEEYNDPEKWINNTTQYSVTVGKKLAVQNGMLGVAPYGSKADLFYEFMVPQDSHALEVDVDYRAWAQYDIAWIGWAKDGKVFRWLDVPRERGKSNHWRGVFRNGEDLPYEKLYLHFLIMNRERTRPEGDFTGAALEDFQVRAIQDPLYQRRQARLDSRTWTLDGAEPYWTAVSEKVEAIGMIRSQGGMEYPLALKLRQGWRGGVWIVVNAPELLKPADLERCELLDGVLARTLKKYAAPDRRLTTHIGRNYLAAAKALGAEPLMGVEFQAPAPDKKCVVFDVFAHRIVPSEIQGKAARFTDDLPEPYASRLYFIKSAQRPVLLMTDGNLSRAADYGDGEYDAQARTLAFDCAREAWIYSPSAPIAVRNLDGVDLPHNYNVETGLLSIQTAGAYGRVVAQFNQ